MTDYAKNTFGWQAMREGSVDPSVWDELYSVYVKDSHGLGLRRWFEEVNPHALQEVLATSIEAVRKGFWKPEAKVVAERKTDPLAIEKRLDDTEAELTRQVEAGHGELEVDAGAPERGVRASMYVRPALIDRTRRRMLASSAAARPHGNQSFDCLS